MPLDARVAIARELRDPATIRARCANVLAAAEAGASPHFTVVRSRLPVAADRVAEVTRARYPTLAIPYHSRWRHFEAGGVDRRAELGAALAAAGADTAERARAQIDLTVVSVLLDAGAGAAWGWTEPATGLHFTRSEGLGVASFRAFMAGAFSSDPARPLRADARGLRALDAGRLARLFQVGPGRPLVGLEGRAALMNRLGDQLAADRLRFGSEGRPGGLFDHLLGDRAADVPATDVPAADLPAAAAAPAAPALTAARILGALLDGLSPIWLTGSQLDGVPLGDAWPHPHAGGQGATAGWVPFHKLSQWLTYSLLEPFAWAGVPVQGLDALTALPEYRNGGLLLDTGVLVAREPGFHARVHRPSDPAIVTWRALTVALVDVLAPLVRERLGGAPLPLACLLEGGTWAAGRELARRLRAGDPPVRLDSDGTVF